LLKVVGAKNVFTSSNLSYPQISTEGIISLNPDIIIEIVHPNILKKHSIEELKSGWNRLKEINAVKNKKIYIYTKSYATIPGPRIGQIAEDFFDFIHKDN
jgi:iron complex transport system substrate-binding protein